MAGEAQMFSNIAAAAGKTYTPPAANPTGDVLQPKGTVLKHANGQTIVADGTTTFDMSKWTVSTSAPPTAVSSGGGTTINGVFYPSSQGGGGTTNPPSGGTTNPPANSDSGTSFKNPFSLGTPFVDPVGTMGTWISAATGGGYSGPKQNKDDTPAGGKKSSIIPSSGSNILSTSDQARALQQKIADTQNQIKALQDQLTTAQSMGYDSGDTIYYDENKNIVPNPKTNGGTTGMTAGGTVASIIQQLKDAGIVAPVAPSLTSTYNTLSSQYNLPDLQSQINDIDTQIATVTASLNEGLNVQAGKLAPMELITSRQTALRNQAQQQLDQLNIQKTNLVNQYNNALSTVKMIMDFTQQDYTNASNAYSTAMDNFFKINTALNTQQNTQTDNLRANLTLIYNTAKSSGKDWESLPDSLKASIKSLEMQIPGYPVGVTEYLLENLGKDQIIYKSPPMQDADGNDYIQVLTKDSDGVITSQNVYNNETGSSKVSSSTSSTQSQAEKDVANFQKDAASYILMMNKYQINWAGAWSALHAKYPSATTEQIDETLGLDNRDLYDKPL